MIPAWWRLLLVIALAITFSILPRGTAQMQWPNSSCENFDHGLIARPPFPSKFELTERAFCGD